MFLARLRSQAGSKPDSVLPFGDEPGALPALDTDLAGLQARSAAAVGLELKDVDGAEPLPEGTIALCGRDALFTPETLTALRAASARGGVVQAAVARGTALFERASPGVPGPAPAPHLPLPLWAGALAGLIVGGHEGAVPYASLVPVCDDEDHVRHRVDPYGPAPHVLRIPSGPKLGGRYVHWLHVLDLNLALLARARPAATVRRGRAKIHPTALVERSILEDGVEIGAHASVIDAWIGAGTRIADHNVVVSSAIGPRCQTLVDTHLRRVVAMAGATLSNLDLEDTIVGHDVFVTTAATFFRGRPGATVIVDAGADAEVGFDSGRPCLGGALGHRVILGARALFGAGVAVPGGAVVVLRPDEGATRLDEIGLARASMRTGDPSFDV